MRTILHADLNNFFASVECLYNPALWKRPMAVAGDPKARHGIVLAKNQLAKACGVQTGEPLWQARQHCPELAFVPPHFERYEKYARLARELYIAYTDKVESFGMDECWLDVSGALCQYGSGSTIAGRIRQQMKQRFGLTVSVGVSFNKVFAKLGSDMKKPDATTEITKDNYQALIWPLPVSSLLFVGRATEKKLHAAGVQTIGQLAACDAAFLHGYLGKAGLTLHRYANGLDDSPVADYFAVPAVKSVSNGTTTPRDLETDDDIKAVLCHLCEKVARRLRQQNCLCTVLQLGIRDCSFAQYSRQCSLSAPTACGSTLFHAAWDLFSANRPSCGRPLRHLSVCGTGLRFAGQALQLSLFAEEQRALRRSALDNTLDRLSARYGQNTVQRGIELHAPELVQNSLPSSFGAVLDGSSRSAANMVLL